MRMLVYVQRHCIGMFVCVQDIVHHIISIWNKPIRPFSQARVRALVE